jgi:hypothetical protein
MDNHTGSVSGYCPDFFIIGAPKSGTTTLFRMLCQHPHVYGSPLKEPHFFSFGYPGDQGEDEKHEDLVGEKSSASHRKDASTGPPEAGSNTVRSWPDYRDLFSKAGEEQITGEASTSYMANPNVPSRIKRHCSRTRVLAILRNPVDRAYSQYLHHVRSGREPCDSFEEALASEEQRIDAGWSVFWTYKRTGEYHRHLQNWYQHFPREKIKIVTFEEFMEHPISATKDTYQFLGVGTSFEPTLPGKTNATGVPRNRLVHNILNIGGQQLRSTVRSLVPEGVRRFIRSMRNQNLRRPPLSQKTRHRLEKHFREDVQNLERLVDKDFSQWLETVE